MTKLAHGEAAAASAAETARKTFEEHALGADLPVVEVPRGELQKGVPLFTLLHRAGLAASGGEARRLVKGRGAKVNDRTIDVETRPVTLEDLSGDGVVKLSAGKKRHALVKPV